MLNKIVLIVGLVAIGTYMMHNMTFGYKNSNVTATLKLPDFSSVSK